MPLEENFEDYWVDIRPGRSKSESLGIVELPPGRDTVWVGFSYRGSEVSRSRKRFPIPDPEDGFFIFRGELNIEEEILIDRFDLFLTPIGGPWLDGSDRLQLRHLLPGSVLQIDLRVRATGALRLLLEKRVTIHSGFDYAP
ncbi:MAG: hypothetical protein WCY09_09110 [Candidatus Omnitrophota bacterium]|jgi:hypothetical protein